MARSFFARTRSVAAGTRSLPPRGSISCVRARRRHSRRAVTIPRPRGGSTPQPVEGTFAREQLLHHLVGRHLSHCAAGRGIEVSQDALLHLVDALAGGDRLRIDARDRAQDVEQLAGRGLPLRVLNASGEDGVSWSARASMFPLSARTAATFACAAITTRPSATRWSTFSTACRCNARSSAVRRTGSRPRIARASAISRRRTFEIAGISGPNPVRYAFSAVL